MKVLHCITGLNVGGAEMMLYRFLRRLGPRAARHSVLSLMRTGEIGHEVQDLGIQVFSAELPQGKISASGVWRVHDSVRKFDPDVIHGWMYHGNLAGSLAAMFSFGHPRVVWSIHHSLHDLEVESRRTRLILKLLKPLSHKVGAITYCSRISAEQHEHLGFDPRKRVVIPNGVELDEFRPRPKAKQHLADLCGVPPERVLLGNFARDHPMKDQVSLVHAAVPLLERGHDLQVVIIGRGHGNGRVREAAEELGIADRVSTFESRNDVPEIVPGLDLFVLCSAWGESFPLAVAEALSAGVPVVVTDVGDCARLVGDCGVVVPPRDTEALVAAIERLLLLSPDARRELGTRGRARVAQRFSIDQFVHAHEDLYDDLTAEKKYVA